MTESISNKSKAEKRGSFVEAMFITFNCGKIKAKCVFLLVTRSCTVKSLQTLIL